MYHWDTSSADPEEWTVAVTGRPVFDPDVQHHPHDLTGYLDALAKGRIKAAALGDWPSADAKIERRVP
jgi:hypothetical protein